MGGGGGGGRVRWGEGGGAGEEERVLQKSMKLLAGSIDESMKELQR